MRDLMLAFLVFFYNISFAQNSLIVQGTVKNSKGEPLSNATVKIRNSLDITRTDDDGYYSVKVAEIPCVLIFSLIGYQSQSLTIDFGDSRTYRQDIIMESEILSLDEVTVTNGNARHFNSVNINPHLFENLPSVSSNFESLLKTLPGVSINNELSSQYSVRGGNFDENLIYINDIEIYRPFQVRSGQQEGLSFINPELAGSVNFSAGGFEPRYGDKLSSVLDVRYSKPDSSELTASAGLLGFSASYKGLAANNKSFILIGLRDKTNQSILKKQPVKGSYQPNFYDFQMLGQTDITPKISFSLMGIYNLNQLTLIPGSRETVFGTQSQVLQLDVNYNGREKDRYESMMGAASLILKPSDNFTFKWINSAFSTNENENFNIAGSYLFDDITGPGDGADTSLRTGSYYSYGNNKLRNKIYTSEIKAYLKHKDFLWETGIKAERDRILGFQNEYSIADSADDAAYPGIQGPFISNDAVYSNNEVTINRVMGYIQAAGKLSEQIGFNAGLRLNYNSFTDETLISPRTGITYNPSGNPFISYKFSVGVYDQPPFYSELKNLDGSLNRSVKSQRSIHFLGGVNHVFNSFGTVLNFSSELYFKKLNNLIPYKVEDLRIRYLPDQISKGYAAGADFSLDGEFVKDLESSFRLSLMKTAEDIDGDFYYTKNGSGKQVRVEPGYLKRPTDQRVNFSVFFQDKLFENPTYKVHLNLLYGSALPVGPPKTERYQDVFKIPAYKRVDIGFSKDFLDKESKFQPAFLKRNFNSLVLYIEAFNLLNINNTVSYLWIRDVNNYQYAVPNYLTSRQLNLKIIAKFRNK